MKTEIFILGALIVLFVLFLLSMLLRNRKKEFDNIKVGDIIFYPTVSLLGTTFDDDESDVVTHVDYFDTGEVKAIYTKKGNIFNFLNYFREDFYKFSK